MSGPAALFARVCGRPGAVWLDGGGSGRSILAWAPQEVLTEGADWPAAGRALTRRQPSPDGFAGVIGYLGYGAGHRVEAVPPEAPTPEPELWLGRYEGAALWEGGRWRLSGPAAFRREAEALLDSPEPPVPPARPRPSRTVDRAEYEAAVRRIQAWIAAGDCYQVNLTRPVHVDDVGPPLPVYLRLRARSDAARGAVLALSPDTWILSNSPETLLTVRGRALFADPIKGTRPRGATPAEDAAQREALAASPKDHAELAMIADLTRNDLGRVAAPGTVRAGARTLTAHATVHHAAWPVHAQLADGRDSWDALAAMFPPGSVTGAPKVRACERIAALEADPRGVYCGAIGYIADGGEATWSVAIRTAVWHRGQARYHVGGAIVADSDPADEWTETEHKGAALAAALGAG